MVQVPALHVPTYVQSQGPLPAKLHLALGSTKHAEASAGRSVGQGSNGRGGLQLVVDCVTVTDHFPSRHSATDPSSQGPAPGKLHAVSGATRHAVPLIGVVLGQASSWEPPRASPVPPHAPAVTVIVKTNGTLSPSTRERFLDIALARSKWRARAKIPSFWRIAQRLSNSLCLTVPATESDKERGHVVASW